MNRNTKIAAAVAALLSTGIAGQALAVPTIPQAQNPSTVLYIAGSSAAKSAVLNAIEINICGGPSNALIFSSTGDTNFFAVSCAALASTGINGANGTNVFTVYYRDEGGSVVGALPLVSKLPINQLNLASAVCSGNTCTVPVPGSAAANGLDDSFASGVVKQPVQLGITDVEPSRFILDNFPSAYKTSVYGTATPAQLAALNATPIFQQVFGVFVNTSGPGFSAAQQACQGKPASATQTCLSLSKSTVTNLLQGNTSDWSTASDINGNPVTSSSQAVTVVNREQGSGSRTSASIYFTGDECTGGASSIFDPAGANGDFFSTGNVLAAANSTPGSITYASIDNAGSGSPNLTLVAINGIAATNLTAAQGQYDYWYEATAVGPIAGLTASQNSLAAFLINAFQNESTAPHAVDIMAIPGAGSSGNTPSLPVSGTVDTGPSGTATPIFINPFTRSGASCTTPLNAI
jgi:hypothetical protein